MLCKESITSSCQTTLRVRRTVLSLWSCLVSQGAKIDHASEMAGPFRRCNIESNVNRWSLDGPDRECQSDPALVKLFLASRSVLTLLAAHEQPSSPPRL